MTINHEGHLQGFKTSQTGYNGWIRTHDPCAYCGKTPNGNRFTLDHVVALADGGPNVASNKTVACYECNHSKGARSVLLVLLEQRHKHCHVPGCRCRKCKGTTLPRHYGLASIGELVAK